MYNVLIVDDQRTARTMIENIVEGERDYNIVYSIENAALAEMYCMKEKIDLVLMDVCTAHGENGIDAAAQIKRKHPHIKIIIVTSMPEHSFIVKSKEAGCDSFWYKDFGDESLSDVMRKTMSGQSVYPICTPIIDIGMANSDEFTSREMDVLRGLVAGYSYREISEELGISENTLKSHIKNLLSKTGYKSTMQLAVDVVNKKLILPGF